VILSPVLHLQAANSDEEFSIYFFSGAVGDILFAIHFTGTGSGAGSDATSGNRYMFPEGHIVCWQHSRGTLMKKISRCQWDHTAIRLGIVVQCLLFNIPAHSYSKVLYSFTLS